MRTNITIDDEIMKKALEVSGLKTKKEVIEKALQEFIFNNSKKDLSELVGLDLFADDYDHKALRGRRNFDTSSQVLRLPKEFSFNGDDVCIRKIGDLVILCPKEKAESLFFSSLGNFTDDVFETIYESRQENL